VETNRAGAVPALCGSRHQRPAGPPRRGAGVHPHGRTQPWRRSCHHALFWTILAPHAGGAPKGAIADAIARDFGSFARFQALFADAAAKHFGSAWAFLVVDPSTHRLEIRSLPNQDSVVSAGTPALLCCDVWEHAYYLTYRNRRPDYLAAWWSVVAWDVVDGGSRRRHDRDVTAVVCRGTLGPQPRAGQPRHRKVDGAVIRT